MARGALAAAREEPHPGARIRLVALTCALVAKAVGPDEVRRLAAEAAEDVRGPSGAEHRDEVLSTLAQALAMAGDRAGAHRLLEQIGSARHRAEALRLDVWSSVLADGGPVAWRLAGVLADEYAAVTAAPA